MAAEMEIRRREKERERLESRYYITEQEKTREREKPVAATNIFRQRHLTTSSLSPLSGCCCWLCTKKCTTLCAGPAGLSKLSYREFFHLDIFALLDPPPGFQSSSNCGANFA